MLPVYLNLEWHTFGNSLIFLTFSATIFNSNRKTKVFPYQQFKTDRGILDFTVRNHPKLYHQENFNDDFDWTLQFSKLTRKRYVLYFQFSIGRSCTDITVLVYKSISRHKISICIVVSVYRPNSNARELILT